jgi:cytochrome P450
MRAYEGLIRAATRDELTNWPAGAEVSMLDAMQAITLRVVLRAVFGLKAATGLDASLRRLMTWTTDMRRTLVFGFLGPDRLMALHGFRRQRADVDRQLLAEIAARRAASDLESRTDVLSLLLLAGLDDGELRDELMTLLVAGYETTAAALSWALTELAADPAAQARLAAGEPGLAEAAVTETLRLHPPLALGGIRLLRGPLEIAGRELPAGTTVTPCAMLLHRRADVYERPLQWRVDRFLGTRPPAGAWVPFGGGVRRCAGAALAQFEARVALDEIVRSRELIPAGRRTGRVSRRGIVTIPPGGAPVITVPR